MNELKSLIEGINTKCESLKAKQTLDIQKINHDFVDLLDLENKLVGFCLNDKFGKFPYLSHIIYN